MAPAPRWYYVVIRDPDWGQRLEVLANVLRIEDGRFHLERVTENGETISQFIAEASSVVYIISQDQHA